VVMTMVLRSPLARRGVSQTAPDFRARIAGLAVLFQFSVI
jgi:hypothetical protein